MHNTKRLFLAIHIHDVVLDEQLLPQLKQHLSHENISWTKKGQTHITLKFLGDTHCNHIPAIEAAFALALKDFSPFELQIRKLKMFGSRYKPSILWIAAEDKGQMKKMFSNITAALVPLGILPDRQNFIPHLTLGRIKDLKKLDYFQKTLDLFRDVEASHHSISEVILYESRLEKTGAVHIPLCTFHLKPSMP